MEMDPMDHDDNVGSGPNDKLARKIAAGQERNRARSAVRQVVDDHPIALLAGGIVLGALVARLLPKSAFGKVGKRAASLAAMGAEMAALYGSKVADTAGEAARESREKLESLGSSVTESASEARRKTSDFADLAVSAAKSVGSKALRKVSDAAERVRP